MLQVKQIVKIYPGPTQVLSGIDLDVNNGLFGLLGPNGAGKTTFMKIVAGLLEPTSGTLYLDNVNIVKNPEYLKDKLGYLPQEFGFYPNLTGEIMLKYLLRLKGISGKKELNHLTLELLDRVNLLSAAKIKIKNYSGGMKQRLGIAQTIAGDPQLIIVDEPTAGLDPEERLRFYRLLSELAENRIILMSTHIVEDVAVLCPQFAVIRSGILITKSTPNAVKAALNGKIFEGSIKKEQLKSFGETNNIIQSVLAAGQNRVRIFNPENQPPNGFESVEPTLEDAYLIMMKENNHLQKNGIPSNN